MDVDSMDADTEDDAALSELAERCGIELEYLDARGERQHVSPDTQRKLLDAMGIAAKDEEEVLASLGTLEDEEWQHALPGVCVAQRNKGPATLELVLPAGTETVEWRIGLESGSELRGSQSVSALTLLARCVRGSSILERRRLTIEENVPDGYHVLSIEGREGHTTFIMSPGVCWLPGQIVDGRRLWGLAIQLYSLRSRENWGIGDFTDLGRLISLTALAGGHVVGVNPLHALFPDEPKRASPYSPASRLLLNVLNIDVQAVPEFTRCAEAQRLVRTDEFQALLANARDSKQIDYERIARLKWPVLRLLFTEFDRRGDALRRKAFESFRVSQVPAFEQACVFQALREHLVPSGSPRAWQRWPPEFRDCKSPAVAEFARSHATQVTEITWMQWLAEEQLREAVKPAHAMPVGLYRDMAVGADASAAESWSDPGAFITRARVGAPPDIYNPAGQDWGLLPFSPQALRAQCYRSFIELLRANMRHSGGLRIDHVMGLLRLYWIPEGCRPEEGGYVGYPFEDLLGILALESQRQECLVVGEDLGTVPSGFRERMARAQVLSYRVLFFEQDAETGVFNAPDTYPNLALAVSGSHDLPTLRGWWEGTDLTLKERLHLFPDSVEAGQARKRRERDRTLLLDALRDVDLVKPGAAMDWRTLMRPVHEFLARSSAALAMAQLEDVAGEADPTNVPGTVDQYPNWSRRLSVAVEDLPRHPVFNSVAQIFRTLRKI
jgi:4-alpha-glucanotransferase